MVFENGHRNDGWADFRDNHLIPEMKEPVAPMETELKMVKVAEKMAWAYTKTIIHVKRKPDEASRILLLWSSFVLEKHDEQWKIALLDWSIRQLKDGESEEINRQSAEVPAGHSRWTLQTLEDYFRNAGLEIRQDVSIRQPFLSVAGKVLVIGDDAAELQVYIYRDARSRTQDTEKLDPERVAPSTMQIAWLMPPSLITDHNLAIITLTRDEKLRTRIKDIVSSKESNREGVSSAP